MTAESSKRGRRRRRQGQGRTGQPQGWDRAGAIATTSWREPPEHLVATMDDEVLLDLGWGRLVFGQTYADHDRIRDVLRAESEGRRDICLYLRDPHVLVARYPHELFIDPSYTYRLWFHRYRPAADRPRSVRVRFLNRESDAEAMNRIYVRCGMVPAPIDVIDENQRGTRHITYLVAELESTGEVVGTVTGVDHERLFNDPDGGCSLWSLAVDPACPVPGVGEALVRTLVEYLSARGRSFLDLSVMHDNAPAIRLYAKLGFDRVPVFGVKRKNAINESLFTQSFDDLDHLNPYARIIADEAIRRGLRVTVLDAPSGELRIEQGGRSVVTRESLSELTSAVAMSRCDDKRVTRKIVAAAGIAVPRGRTATFDGGDKEFLEQVGDLVVKPVRGEQGQGITVGVRTDDELAAALERAGGAGVEIILEERCEGDDLRVVVIDGTVVAAAVRRPAEVVGTGRHTVEQLIEAQSRRRSAATGGESTIPLDDLTVETVREAGWELDEVLPEGKCLRVRRTANLHTGGTIHDVTTDLHPELATAAIGAAAAIGIPVTGIDLLVPSPSEPDYVFIEANERPGLANHEPQPTAAAFVDFLFPGSNRVRVPWKPAPPTSAHHAPGEP